MIAVALCAVLLALAVGMVRHFEERVRVERRLAEQARDQALRARELAQVRSALLFGDPQREACVVPAAMRAVGLVDEERGVLRQSRADGVGQAVSFSAGVCPRNIPLN